MRLVDYVCLVDEASPDLPFIPSPSLSYIFSGMLLTISDQTERFDAGLGILRAVLELGLDPFATLPAQEG